MEKKSMTLNQFLHQRQTSIVPFFREVLADLDTPLSCFMKLKHSFPTLPAFLLESVESKEKLGRFSFIGFDPFLVFKSLDTKIILEGIIEEELEYSNPFILLKKIMNKISSYGFPDNIACYGGAVGYAGYDVIRFFENIPLQKKRNIGIYDMHFVFSKKLVIFDNFTRKMTLIIFNVNNNKKSIHEICKEGEKELDMLHKIIRSPLILKDETDFSVKMKENNTSKEEFEKMVLRVKEYIFSGDVIQVVLSQRFEMEIDIDGLNLYRALRVVNPSPYMFYLDCIDYSFIGSSPEMLVKMVDGEVEVRPIAGTIQRNKNHENDDLLEKQLLSDAKERAEHTMLVDLGRNDVGRIAVAGSVKVPEFMGVEKYSHVMHIVSSVRGKLRNDLDAFDVFQAVFPAGTVAGAPKIRAMEIIEELEKDRREFYAGCVGYFAYNGNMDFCITIRTLLKKQKKIYIQAGAGIVADSSPEKEYMETINKTQALMQSIMELKEIIN